MSTLLELAIRTRERVAADVRDARQRTAEAAASELAEHQDALVHALAALVRRALGDEIYDLLEPVVFVEGGDFLSPPYIEVTIGGERWCLSAPTISELTCGRYQQRQVARFRPQAGLLYIWAAGHTERLCLSGNLRTRFLNLVLEASGERTISDVLAE